MFFYFGLGGFGFGYWLGLLRLCFRFVKDVLPVQNSVVEFIVHFLLAQERLNSFFNKRHLEDLIYSGPLKNIYLKTTFHQQLHILTVVGWDRGVVARADLLA
jgi:hypothetical protein